jgi:hypothetical protein
MRCAEVNNSFEPGDEWIDRAALKRGLMFRQVDWIEDQIDRSLSISSLGELTAMWYNVLSSLSCLTGELVSTISEPHQPALSRGFTEAIFVKIALLHEYLFLQAPD